MKRDVKRSAAEIKSDQSEASHIQLSSPATEPGNPTLFSTSPMPQPDVRILLVEDDAQTRDYLHRLLARQWTVDMVSDGAAALAAACTRPPDLVLTDVLMPGMDGLTLLRELRTNPQTQNVPIILFSGQASEETMIEGFAAGADDYLIKPFSGQELLARVGARLSLNRLHRQVEVDRQAAYAQAQAEQKRVIHILESISDAFATLDEAYRYLYINQKAEDLVKKLVGKSKLDLLGQSIWDVFPRLTTSPSGEQYRRAMTERVAVHFEDYFRPLNAWFDVHIYPNEEGLSVYFQEITTRKRTEVAQHLLAQAGQVLTSPLDYQARLEQVAQLAVPLLADWCAVNLYDEDWTVHHVAVAHVDPAKVELAREVQRRYPTPQEELLAQSHPWQQGQSQLISEINEAMLQAGARNEEHLQILRDLHLHSAMAVPLLVRERILGLIAFFWAESNRRYDEQDLALAEELARRIAIAMDNARLYQAEQQARQAAEITAERLATLQAVTARLAQAMTPAEVVQTVFMYGLSTMEASGIVFTHLTEKRDEFELIKAVGYPAEVMESWQRFPLKSGLPMADVVQSGEPLYIESRAKAAALYPGFVAADRKNNHQAWVVLPLITEHEAIGAMSISFAQARVFDREERAFLLTLGRQSAQALDRARLFTVEQQARQEAETNQHRLALLAEMRERNRLAQELHDTVAQALGYLNLKISLTHTLLESDQFEQAQANFKELRQVINETYTDVREEIFYLRAKTLSDLSFLELLERYVEKYRRFYNLEIHLVQEADPALFEFSAETTSQLVRTIQEALINVRKHAQVNTATIRLGQENGEIRITIEDQGQGFDAEQAKTKATSFGLQIMHERIESIGGSLEVNSAAGQGTRIIVRYRPRPELNDVETF